MKIRTISMALIICLSVSVNGIADTTKKDTSLQIYLPREITIDSNTASLGQVGIIRGEESIAAKAAEITLGRISLPGQEIVVDRDLILSRLACSGVNSSEVIFTGAEKVLVKRQHRVIKASELLESALSFLQKTSFDGSVCEFSPIRIPKDIVISGQGGDIKLLPQLLKSKVKNKADVRVAVLEQGKEIGVCEVSFQLKYNCHRVITITDIPQGAAISQENVKIEKIVSNHPEPVDWTAPFGLIAKRRLQANIVIKPDMVGCPELPVLLKRNQNVVIQLDRFGILVTAAGKAIEEGKVGEYIKVQNVDSQRIIVAKVNEDGTVEPVF